MYFKVEISIKFQQSLYHYMHTAGSVGSAVSPRGCLLVNTDSRGVDICFVE